MKIKQCFNTTEKQIESKKYNILIPICLGNKYFTVKNSVNENVEKYIKWALEHTKNKVLILVADKIQHTNFIVRSHNRTEEASIRMVMRDGKLIKNSLDKLVSKFSKNNRARIATIRWEEYEKQDLFFSHTIKLVYDEFENNKKFKQEVIKAVKGSVVDRKFSDNKYLKLCNYVLDEFSVVYSGTVYLDNYYGIYIYPEADSVVHLIEDIKKRKIFTDLHDMLPKQTIALGILN